MVLVQRGLAGGDKPRKCQRKPRETITNTDSFGFEIGKSYAGSFGCQPL